MKLSRQEVSIQEGKSGVSPSTHSLLRTRSWAGAATATATIKHTLRDGSSHLAMSDILVTEVVE